MNRKSALSCSRLQLVFYLQLLYFCFVCTQYFLFFYTAWVFDFCCSSFARDNLPMWNESKVLTPLYYISFVASAGKQPKELVNISVIGKKRSLAGGASACFTVLWWSTDNKTNFVLRTLHRTAPHSSAVHLGSCASSLRGQRSKCVQVITAHCLHQRHLAHHPGAEMLPPVEEGSGDEEKIPVSYLWALSHLHRSISPSYLLYLSSPATLTGEGTDGWQHGARCEE